MKEAKSVTIRKFQMEGLEEVEARLESAAHGIRREDWSPNPGVQCGRCSLSEICPALPEGGPEFG